jgi:putative ABC transport system permease protein
MVLALSILTLVIAGIGIANMTLVSVNERTTEIGLRRALGAQRTHILLQFLFETAVVGVFGALVGAAAGIVVVSLVAEARDWTPVLDQRLVFAAPLAGGAIGFIAGAYPAWRASTVQPSEAIRGIR